MKHPLEKTLNDILVHVDLIGSRAARQIAQNPQLLGLVKKAIRQTTALDDDVTEEYDMGRGIGYDFVVPTTDRDTILYAKPTRDNYFTRFVKNGKPLPTQHLSIVLRRDGDAYELLDAWIGHVSPPRPGTEEENAESRPYWENHAVVITSHALQLHTLTKICPY